MYDEDDFLPVSALQHLVFCERQWALIHLEGIWEENRLTAEGRLLHERVDAAETESRGAVRIARALPISSRAYGLAGRADAVEFQRAPPGGGGVVLAGAPGRWIPFPIEYKRGRPKPHSADRVQLCAQAFCLEEMLETAIAGGALYYGRPHRRHPVAFDAGLREEARHWIRRLHELTGARATPPAAYSPKCDQCSLIGTCLPKLDFRASRYLLDEVCSPGP